MKKILYELFQAFSPSGEPITLPVELKYSESNLAIAEKEAYNGYTIEDDGQPVPTSSDLAPRNITAGEYATVNGTMYKATENIPNGEPIITGQNAVETTIEEQLYELTKGE